MQHGKHAEKTLGGINAQVSKQVSHLDAITFSTEIYYDAGIQSIKENLHDYSSNVFAGLLIGHEFLFNRIIFQPATGPLYS